MAKHDDSSAVLPEHVPTSTVRSSKRPEDVRHPGNGRSVRRRTTPFPREDPSSAEA